MDKVYLYERITLNFTCPKCQAHNEFREDETATVGDTVECEECGEEFEYDMSD